MVDKIALINGSSREQGLGFAVARELAGRSFQVVLTSRELARVERLADQLRAEGVGATALALDVTDAASVAACAETMARRFDHLDVLVNSSSTVPDFDARTILDAQQGSVLDAYAVNVAGTWALTQALLPLLRRAPAARVVNISSQDALRIPAAAEHATDVASPGFSLAKYALNALTTAFAAALRDTPILVNAVDPGETATHPETGDEGSARSPADSARGVVWAALLPAGGPTGGFFRDGQPLR